MHELDEIISAQWTTISICMARNSLQFLVWLHEYEMIGMEAIVSVRWSTMLLVFVSLVLHCSIRFHYRLSWRFDCVQSCVCTSWAIEFDQFLASVELDTQSLYNSRWYGFMRFSLWSFDFVPAVRTNSLIYFLSDASSGKICSPHAL